MGSIGTLIIGGLMVAGAILAGLIIWLSIRHDDRA